MKIGPRQLEALRQIILDHHQAFVANFVSPEIVPPQTLERLKRLGVLKPQSKTVQDAYFLGVLASHAPNEGEEMTYNALRQRIKARALPLTDAERHAVKVAEMNAGQYLTGLGGRVAADVGQNVLEMSPGSIFDYHAETKDRNASEAYRRDVQSAVSRAIAERAEVSRLKSDLGHATGDWNRNLERVANTELASALAQGTVRAAVGASRGRRVRCAVTSAVDCCKYCAEIWLVPGTRTPRIYYLDELEENGSNVGRKASEYKACVPPTHINCRCQLRIVPAGMEFDEKGRLRPY